MKRLMLYALLIIFLTVFTLNAFSVGTSNLLQGNILIENGTVAAGKGVSQIPGFVEHGAQRALERGFTPERIAQVLKEGNVVEAAGRYGAQTRYTLGSNTVVVSTEGRNAGQIITTFSSETINGIKGFWVEP
jgi:hypothetical protein